MAAGGPLSLNLSLILILIPIPSSITITNSFLNTLLLQSAGCSPGPLPAFPHPSKLLLLPGTAGRGEALTGSSSSSQPRDELFTLKALGTA